MKNKIENIYSFVLDYCKQTGYSKVKLLGKCLTDDEIKELKELGIEYECVDDASDLFYVLKDLD